MMNWNYYFPLVKLASSVFAVGTYRNFYHVYKYTRNRRRICINISCSFLRAETVFHCFVSARKDSRGYEFMAVIKIDNLLIRDKTSRAILSARCVQGVNLISPWIIVNDGNDIVAHRHAS